MKGKGRMGRMPTGGGLRKQVEDLQNKLAEAQQALENQTIAGTAGGGAVTVVMTGHQKVVSVTLDSQVVDPEDVEMLQDLIVAAVNDAVDKSHELASQSMGGLTAGLNIPGLF